eukprot:sb/3474825/
MASETWSEIEKGEIIKAFAVFDRNKDGYVDAEELRYALCTYGEPLSTDEAKEVRDLSNTNMYRLFMVWNYIRLDLVFCLILMALTALFSHFNPGNNPTQLLTLVDLDKDGLIDYSEFQKMMTTDEASGDCRQQ